MIDNDELSMEEQRGKRPTFLTVLCVLTFISTGLSLLFNIVQLAGGPLSEEAMTEQRVVMSESISKMQDANLDSFANMLEQINRMAIDSNNNFYIAMSVAILAAAIGLFATLKMWKGEKIGFHLYIVYNLIAIGGLYLYVAPAHIPTVVIVINLILSGLFIFLYSRNLHWMK